MAEDQPEKTGKQVIAEQFYKLNLVVEFDDDKTAKSTDPVLAALAKKLEGLSKAAKIEHGIFGKEFFKDKLKAFTGFDSKLVTGIQNLLNYGKASKEGIADNGEFFNSLNPIGKALVNLASMFDKKRKSEKEAADQTKKTTNAMSDLDKELARAEGMDKANEGMDIMTAQLDGLGPITKDVAGGMSEVTAGTEGATVAVEAFASAATLGIALVVVGVLELSKLLFQIIMQTITTRAEFKKFDQLFGGIGAEGIRTGIGQLKTLNTELWGLGMSMEKVNEVVFNSVAQGLNFSRAIDTTLVKSVVELSGATGIAADQIGTLYAKLLMTTNISVNSLREMGNSFIAFNRAAHESGILGQVSFATFSSAITNSANALAIAANKGEAFTNKMTKDLMALSSIATNLSEDIGVLNSKFEEAGSMLSSPDSGFRTLLALSGGANINQMLTNQFDKTDAMLKGIVYVKELNKSFGGNMQMTAQIAAQNLGMSKEMTIKMINMRQDQMDALRKAQEDIAGLQTDATRDAYEQVNSGIMDAWGRVKTMFTAFFQNAFGSSNGMIALVQKLEGFVAKLRNYMENAGWIKKLSTIIDNIAEWVASKLEPILDWVGEKLDAFLNATGDDNPLVAIWNTLVETLKAQMEAMGYLVGKGILQGVLGSVLKYGTVGGWIYSALTGDSSSSKSSDSSSNAMAAQINSPLNSQLSGDKRRLGEISNESSELTKYAPDAITYGVGADGQTGFMTIAQKQFALAEEKKKLEARTLALTNSIAENSKKTVEELQKMNGTASPTAAKIPDTVDNFSPIAAGDF